MTSSNRPETPVIGQSTKLRVERKQIFLNHRRRIFVTPGKGSQDQFSQLGCAWCRRSRPQICLAQPDTAAACRTCRGHGCSCDSHAGLITAISPLANFHHPPSNSARLRRTDAAIFPRHLRLSLPSAAFALLHPLRLLHIFVCFAVTARRGHQQSTFASSRIFQALSFSLSRHHGTPRFCRGMRPPSRQPV